MLPGDVPPAGVLEKGGRGEVPGGPPGQSVDRDGPQVDTAGTRLPGYHQSDSCQSNTSFCRNIELVIDPSRVEGERPYWWSDSDISQTEETCQTGPGDPSSHSMSWAVLSYVVFDMLQYKPSSSPAFWLLQLMMGVSRSYTAAHFPHQCVLGSALGDLLHQVQFLQSTLRRFCCGPLCLS